MSVLICIPVSIANSIGCCKIKFKLNHMKTPENVCILTLKIYQSCLATFLTFASKSCGPSYAANKPPGICWLYTFPFQTLNMSLLEKKKEKEKKNTNMANLKRPPSGRGLNTTSLLWAMVNHDMSLNVIVTNRLYVKWFNYMRVRTVRQTDRTNSITSTPDIRRC